MDDKPLEILPFGRTREAQAALDHKREQGRRGFGGCLAMAVAVALLLAWLAGYVQGAFMHF